MTNGPEGRESSLFVAGNGERRVGANIDTWQLKRTSGQGDGKRQRNEQDKEFTVWVCRDRMLEG